jgi:MFS transporter, DHA1 family, multidrug resistance protein
MLPLLAAPPFRRDRDPSLTLLVAVTMTGTVALHIFVPALSVAAVDLGASPFAIQLTVALYLVGLAAGQLVYGPLSDRFGRRPVIMGSLALYLFGILLAIPAAGVAHLIVARVLQSLGACASLVLGRAMVRDVSDPSDATRKLAVLTTSMMLTPALAPALGGIINAAFGWRAIFVALALLVGTLLALVVLTLPETNRRPVALPGIRPVLAGYGRLLRSAKFRHYVTAGSCGATSIYAFLAAAPFLLVDVLGRPLEEVGLYCLVVTGGMVTGALGARQLAGRLEVRHAARRGNWICVAGALSLLAVDTAGFLSVATLIVPLVVYAIGLGLLSPNAAAGLMSVDPDAAGSASSLYGFTQMAFGAAFTLPVALWHTGNALPVALTLLAASGLAACSLHRV